MRNISKLSPSLKSAKEDNQKVWKIFFIISPSKLGNCQKGDNL